MACDAAIVAAEPADIFAAAELARRGRKVRIVDGGVCWGIVREADRGMSVRL